MLEYCNILITGGCGFIGTSIVDRINRLYSGKKVLILDNFVTGTPKDLAEVASFKTASSGDWPTKEGITLVKGDIRDKDCVMQCCKGVDCIIHLAANTGVGPSVQNPSLDMECNVVGTFNLLEAARLNNVKKFIFASSGAPAGEVEPPIHEELPPHPVSPYGASKLAGEGYCSAYYRTFGLRTICLRFGNVYGPRSKKKSSVVAKFIRQALAGEECVIFGDGTQTRDFIYIDDLVGAVLLAMHKDVGGETFQIATGLECTVSEIAELIQKKMHKNGIDMKIVYDNPRMGDVRRNFADTTKAKIGLGWTAAVPLEEGLEKTLSYFLDIAVSDQNKEMTDD